MRLCFVLILLTLLLTSNASNNNDVNVSAILHFARRWQLFTIEPSALSTLELTAITSALATGHNWWYRGWVLLDHTGIHNIVGAYVSLFTPLFTHCSSCRIYKKIMSTPLCEPSHPDSISVYTLTWRKLTSLTPGCRPRATVSIKGPHVSFISRQNKQQRAKLTPYGIGGCGFEIKASSTHLSCWAQMHCSPHTEWLIATVHSH